MLGISKLIQRFYEELLRKGVLSNFAHAYGFELFHRDLVSFDQAVSMLSKRLAES